MMIQFDLCIFWSFMGWFQQKKQQLTKWHKPLVKISGENPLDNLQNVAGWAGFGVITSNSTHVDIMAKGGMFVLAWVAMWTFNEILGIQQPNNGLVAQYINWHIYCYIIFYYTSK